MVYITVYKGFREAWLRCFKLRSYAEEDEGTTNISNNNALENCDGYNQEMESNIEFFAKTSRSPSFIECSIISLTFK